MLLKNNVCEVLTESQKLRNSENIFLSAYIVKSEILVYAQKNVFRGSNWLFKHNYRTLSKLAV